MMLMLLLPHASWRLGMPQIIHQFLFLTLFCKINNHAFIKILKNNNLLNTFSFAKFLDTT